jgi:2C-methyl-D-erythritol 2,4-cyclodiphosphate synthase
VSESNVSVKATTNEKLGPIGQAEGMAAIAIATVEMVERDRRTHRNKVDGPAGRR